MTPDQIKEVLTAHKQWLNHDSNGKRADLRSANLRSANLSGAILRDADLSDAILRSANLRSANLTGADLTGAKIREGMILGRNIGQATRGVDSYVFHAFEIKDSSDIYIFAGCRSFTLTEFKAHIESEYPRTEKAQKTLNCLAYLESLV